MGTDEEFIAQRRKADERAYLISSADPAIAPRIAPAVLAIRSALTDAADPLTHAAVLALALRASDLAVSTVDNLIRRFVKHGFIIKHGEFVQPFPRRRGVRGVDNRAYTLGEWPLTDLHTEKGGS
jgi:hypothetical protein